MEPEIDAIVEEHGTVYLLRPNSDTGWDWIEENVRADEWQWLGGGLSVCPHSIHPILTAMERDGLVIQRGKVQ